MEKSKLIQLLKTFDTKELRAFKDFVASPFFNKNQELVDFYAYLKKQAPQFKATALRPAKVYAKLFPTQPFDEKHVHYLMSFLLKLAEQFLGIQQHLQQPTLHQCHTLRTLVERSLDKHYHYNLTRTEKALSSYCSKDANWFWQDYQVAEIRYQQFLRKNVRRYDSSLQDAADRLDTWYLLTKLKYSCEMLAQQKAIAAHYQLSLIEECIKYLTQHPPTEPLIAIYFQLLRMHLHPEEVQHFHHLKQLIAQYAQQIHAKELTGIYIQATNYCVQKIREGHTAFGDETLGLYVDGIQREVLFENDFLNPWVYKNVVKLGLSMQRYDWTEQFIHQYTPKLEAQFREDALHYNLAELCYYRHQYDAAMEHIHQVQYSDIHYNLGARKLFLKIYYELGEVDALLSQLAAFNIFLKRNKLIPSNVKAPYRHFNQLLNKLVSRKSKNFARLENQIRQTNPLTDRPWLLQKWKELK